MASHFRLATFNAENLFARYRFKQGADPSPDGFTVNDLAFDILDEQEKRITARTIAEVSADAICLQEIESLTVLDGFCSRYLAQKDRRYPYRVLIDGCDPRHIDVAVLSRVPIVAVRSHRHERNRTGSAALFPRDCLEVDLSVQAGRKPFTLMVNHFKSMTEGRAQTRNRRLEQAQRVLAIVRERWPDGRGNFAVCGDLNDYPQTDQDGATALEPLLGAESGLKNLLDNLPEEERWTHFFAGEGERRQLDYILVPPALRDLVPAVMRRGLPHRAGDFDQFEGVGENDPKASDHAPLFVDIPLERVEG